MREHALATSLALRPGSLARPLAEAAARLQADRFSTALFDRNPAAWSHDPEVQARIANRLGWLLSPEGMVAEAERVRRFAETVRTGDVTDVVLLGMGGSSLAPEVLRAVIGVQPGWPRFTMVDAVNPDHLRSITADPRTTLFVLASKSGSTIEPNVLAAYFKQRLIDAGETRWAEHFVAITDPGTALDTRARDEAFRATFRNPADIGGRYSAISLFGLVPAALMGIDLDRLIGDAIGMLRASRETALDTNPSLALGALLGAGALAGRDKLTLIVPPALEPFGLWVEQLVAESTGKQGTGIVPITGEPLGVEAAYGTDRLFVRISVPDLDDDHDRETGRLLAELERAGAPVADITVPDRLALGAEFVRWELATATASALLGINPFDEPNVQQAKDATRVLLESFVREGRLPVPEPDAERGHAALTLTTAARKALAGRPVEDLLTVLRPGDYVGILAYLPEGPEIDAVVRRFRGAVRAKTSCATMFGYGPRYLHSTGQLHKGGANTGVFLLLTAPGQDVQVPDEPFTFGILELAQALGDFASLDQAGRRALHVHLPRPDEGTLERVLETIAEGGAASLVD
jgi:glucose-6-phosphate isomerase